MSGIRVLSKVHLLKGREEVKEYRGQPFSYAEAKLDGFRATVLKQDGRIGVYGKKTDINLWPKLKHDEDFRNLVEGLPDFTMIDGELFVPDGTSGDASTAIARGTGFLFSGFCMKYLNGDSLAKISEPAHRMLLLELGCVVPKQYKASSIEDYFKIIEDAKLEGLVFKQSWYCDWYRLKEVYSIDCICMEIVEGTEGSAREGTLGSIIVGLMDGDTCVEVSRLGKGFTNEQGLEIFRNPLDYLGRVCEVEFDSISQHGKLVFSRLKRWRDDKPRRDCSIRQLEDFRGRNHNR